MLGKKKKIKKPLIILVGILLFIIIFAGGVTTGYFYLKKAQQVPTSLESQQSIYLKFLFEVYDKIRENYWEETTDEQLTNLFKLGSEKLTQEPQTLAPANKEGLATMINKITENMDQNQKKEFSAQLANLVLINLKPFGRSALYAQKQEQDLKNKVQNINPDTNLYENLGVDENASKDEIEEAYKNKIAELEPKKDESSEIKKELEEVKYAYQVLSNLDTKKRYDQSGTEPTVIAKLVRTNILHLYIKRMSSTTLDELKEETEKFDNIEGLDALILDLRGNIGGSLDILTYLLGPFIGQNQYAFELFHQGEYEPIKTKIGWLPSLVRYKKVVILIDENTQSSAEVMAATLKKYNVGIVIGTKTKGWGTIEKVYQLENQIDGNEKYSMFLVNNLTLRDDNQPIEGNGVNPSININDPDWKEQLLAYFNSNELIKVVEEITTTAPPTQP